MVRLIQRKSLASIVSTTKALMIRQTSEAISVVALHVFYFNLELNLGNRIYRARENTKCSTRPKNLCQLVTIGAAAFVQLETSSLQNAFKLLASQAVITAHGAVFCSLNRTSYKASLDDLSFRRLAKCESGSGIRMQQTISS